MTVSIDPKDEIVWDFVKKRKLPVTVKQVRRALLISDAHARRALNYFVYKGLMDQLDTRPLSFRMKQ